MIDPVVVFREGGPLVPVMGYLALFSLIGQIAVGSLSARERVHGALALGLAAPIVLMGLAGSRLGMHTALLAVERASAETKQALLANGISIALFSLYGAMLLAFGLLVVALAFSLFSPGLRRGPHVALSRLNLGLLASCAAACAGSLAYINRVALGFGELARSHAEDKSDVWVSTLVAADGVALVWGAGVLVLLGLTQAIGMAALGAKDTWREAWITLGLAGLMLLPPVVHRLAFGSVADLVGVGLMP